MSYERWSKRMDAAVESTWLRSLRAQDREERVMSRYRFVPTPPPGSKQHRPRLRDRTIVAGFDR